MGYTQETVAKWGREGLIAEANQDSNESPWHISKDAKCPKKI